MITLGFHVIFSFPQNLILIVMTLVHGFALGPSIQQQTSHYNRSCDFAKCIAVFVFVFLLDFFWGDMCHFMCEKERAGRREGEREEGKGVGRKRGEKERKNDRKKEQRREERKERDRDKDREKKTDREVGRETVSQCENELVKQTDGHADSCIVFRYFNLVNVYPCHFVFHISFI